MELIAEVGDLHEIREYISKTWNVLTRDHRDLIHAVVDPKVQHRAGSKYPLYISDKEDQTAVESKLKRSLDLSTIELVRLGELEQRGEEGLLYLPHPYVVPGGRFNEQYNWDSYFINIGLLLEGKLDLARNMIDNHIYQIEHYNTILNANRSYYLSRSQPPFLSAMIREYLKQDADLTWLASCMPAVEKFYAFFTEGLHITNESEYENALSRYFALGDGPASEVLTSEFDAQGRNHYERVIEFYATHGRDYDYGYNVDDYFDFETKQLTALYYKGDRTMRESGVDPSGRFGNFNVDVVHFFPVCLNSLLFMIENDIAYFNQRLGKTDQVEVWKNKAAKRKEMVDRYLWDEERGLYFDYNFKTKQRRIYEFATTFFPLYCGLASPQQAARVAANLGIFERPGGVITSTKYTGCQWDAPFGWAPYQYIAVRGLLSYNYRPEAKRIATKFVKVVLKTFEENSVSVLLMSEA
eukprot:TRINITY_DN4029_c1_g2_i1.p1 TRINITY_DN4029_c1_g2~~TRINITY_DN4029_c1_g2_i1.p1  ORF type:complete len:504 (+),score=54.88 TRINITY_DN4029_c1_g2_i1:111-1514(+)